MTESLDCTDTPSLLVDAARLDANISGMADIARRAGVRLRPHTKTHKSPYIARRQLDAGACGITVAKLGEAEVMAAAGIEDIRIVYPIVGERKLARLVTLLHRASISIALDSHDVATQLSAAAVAAHTSLPVLLEIDTGFHRLGVQPDEAASVAKSLSRLPGIRLAGVLTHEGQVYHQRTADEIASSARAAGKLMVQTASHLRDAGFAIDEVSVGSTPGAPYIASVPGITEIRPGTYIFNDVSEIALGVASRDTCALTVLTTVVSIPERDRAVVDAGSKTLTPETVDAHADWGFGLVKDIEGAVLVRVSQEHGVLQLRDAHHRLEVGQQIEIIPNYACPVVNLADTLYLMRDGRCECALPVEGRGKNR